MKFQLICSDEQETAALGKKLGRLIQNPTILFLSGTLGAGKTRFVQSIAIGLEIEPTSVNSPTFTIMVPHRGRLPLLHVDAYRISDLDEAEQLGIDDWVESGCVLAVEWAEKIEPVLPLPDLKIFVEHRGETERGFEFTATSELGKQILNELAM